MQQFTGMNVIMYYAPKIFELAGYTNTTEQMVGTVIVGLTNVLATFIAIGLVDRWGRKPTLTLGFLVMAAGMGILRYHDAYGHSLSNRAVPGGRYAADVYRRVCNECRSADLGSVL
ncbi:sugar transporter [Enterobacter cloacae]|uniref:Sugar transporter n=1 Tax=Enterobacter cloacae TaxID=550 RepID=A0A377LV80_ENTCL|nr:sugar transporter [Enterobacter cloacae]